MKLSSFDRLQPHPAHHVSKDEGVLGITPEGSLCHSFIPFSWTLSRQTHARAHSLDVAFIDPFSYILLQPHPPVICRGQDYSEISPENIDRWAQSTAKKNRSRGIDTVDDDTCFQFS